jgi:hypothetical protein
MAFESKAVIVPPPPEPKYTRVQLTIDMSLVEAKELAEFCNWIGGMADHSLRGVFSDRPNSILTVLRNAGVEASGNKHWTVNADRRSISFNSR